MLYTIAIIDLKQNSGIYIFVLNFVLLDIDECKLRTHNCHKDYGLCNNTYGSFKCCCKKPGFEGNGVNCEGKHFQNKQTKQRLINSSMTVISLLH